MNIIQGIPPRQPANAWVGVDSEIFTQKGDVKHLHRPHTGKFACITIATDDETVYFIDHVEDVPKALDSIKDCIWVIQNAKFDLTHFRRWADVPPRKRLFDTMLAERIMFNGYYDTFSLKDLSRRYLHRKLEKEVRDEFEGASEFTPERIEYACLDALICRQVALEQRKLMSDVERHIWSDIDLPSLWAFMDFRGFAVDINAWKQLAESNRQRQTEIDAQLPFNPRSSQQVVAWMKSHGFKNLKSSNEKDLTAAIEKYPDSDAAKAAMLTLDSRMYGKRASTYGLDFLEDYLEYDDGIPVIVTNYDISKAETSRISSSNPNMANIPARETKDFRKCFVARPGNKIIIADYKAQEPCISAIVSEDEFLLECFRNKKDIYIELGRQIFGEEITKKDPRRQQMKSLILGIDYGMSEYGLSARENITKEEARSLIKKAMDIMPNLAKWMEKQRQEANFVTTIPGRKIWLNPYSNQRERNALNGTIQGTASEMTKLALVRMHREWPKEFGPFGIVAFVYDEIVADVPEEVAPLAADFICQCMEEEADKLVDHKLHFIAEICIGDSWAEK